MHKTNGIDANHLSLIDSLNTKVATLQSDVTSIKSQIKFEDSSDSTTFKSDGTKITKLEDQQKTDTSDIGTNTNDVKTINKDRAATSKAVDAKTLALTNEQTTLKNEIADNKKSLDQKISNEKSATNELKKVTSDTLTTQGAKNKNAIHVSDEKITALQTQQASDKSEIGVLKTDQATQLTTNSDQASSNKKDLDNISALQ